VAYPIPKTRLNALHNKIKSLQFAIARKCLATWVRPTIIGNSCENLGINDTQPVFYVLPNLSLVDLLITDQVCEISGMPRPSNPLISNYISEQRAFFFLAHREGRFMRRHSMRKLSPRIVRIAESLREQPDEDVMLVPVSLFWGHAPDQEKSLFKYLFSDNWVATGRFKKMFALIFHRRHVVLQYSHPISLRELINSEADPQLQLRKLRRLLRVHYRRQRQAILGPDLSHRRTLVETLLTSTAVQTAINEENQTQQTSISKVKQKAYKYANEIAAHQSYSVIRICYAILTWLWNQLYKGINIHNIERVQELAQSHEVVYVPCHRSHVDYLLLSYVLYENGLPPPHIAAGKNLNMPLLGPILRRAGAFFMRRSFSGDLLYKTVFDEYVHLMLIKGYSVEYFIEGGRSRTGRMLQPRTGMLAMTMHSFRRDPSLPLVFMPVYFGYEKIIEAGTYLNELKGKAKKKESLLDLLSIFKTIKSSFGQVSVNFGEPLFLWDFMQENLPQWLSDEEISLQDSHNAGNKLAMDLATRINKAAAINPINLVAAIVLATPRQSIEETRLIEGLDYYLRLFRAFPYSPDATVTSLSAKQIVDQALKLSLLTRKSYRFGEILSAQGNSAVLLTYYKNNIAHMLALPSLAARLLLDANTLVLDSLIEKCTALYPYLKSELIMHWTVAEMGEVVEELLKAFAQVGLLETDGQQIRLPETDSAEFAALSLISRSIEPTLERFLIAISVLLTPGYSTRKDWESRCQIVAEQLTAIYGLDAPEFFDRSLFSTFISTLMDEAVINNDLIPGEHMNDLMRLVQSCLSPDIQHSVNQAVSQSSH